MRCRARCLIACLALLGPGSVARAEVTAQVVTGSIIANQPAQGLVPPDCPPGTTALGLGLDSEAPNAMSVVEIAPEFPSPFFDELDPGSYPATNSWHGLFANDGDNPHDIAVATLCSPGHRTIEVEELAADPHAVAAARVLCPEGAVAVGGGSSFVPEGRITSSGPVVDDGTPDGARLIDLGTGEAPAPIGWRSTLRNDGDLILSERAAAVCNTGLANVVTMVASATIPESDTASNRVLCGPGQIALGGGVDMTDTSGVVLTASAPVFDNGTPSGQRLLNRAEGESEAPIGWFAAARNEDTIAHTMMIGVVCPEPGADAAGWIAFGALASLAAATLAR